MFLEELGTTFIKLGQVLSTWPDLIPLDYVAELSKLRARAEPRRLVVVAAHPVCGMAVEEAGAVAQSHKGRTYYFCADGCRREFLDDPSAFVGEEAAGVGTPN